jgi:hypothetical protein
MQSLGKNVCFVDGGDLVPVPWYQDAKSINFVKNSKIIKFTIIINSLSTKA